MKLLKKLTAIIILTSMLITLNSPIISYAADGTESGGTGSTGESTTGEQTEEIGTEYEIKEEETWDISKNGDGSVIAKWTLDDKTITISGNGEMKSWSSSSSEDWHSSKYKKIIEKVKIENGLISIEYGAFSGCSSLESIDVEANNQNYLSIDGVLYNKDKTELICYPAGKKQNKYIISNSVTSIEYGAFSGCRSLTSITIPNSVTSISWNAFRECSSLTSINIPNGVKSIDSSAFSSCSSLTNIEIPNSVTSIGVSAFSSCSSLTNIEIPNSVTSIGGSAFEGCSSLTSINIPEGVTSIGSYAFSGCSSLENIEIPNSVTSIASYAFRGCSSLTNIEIPNSVTSIKDGAFSGCSSLASINIPNGVTRIAGEAFRGCSSLTNIEIPNSVTSIGDSAFLECSSLTSINIPEGVTSIGNYSFYGCSSLTNLTIPSSVTSIGNDAFYRCKGPIICNTNSKTHEYCENNKIPYILGDSAISAVGIECEIKEEETWDISKNGDGSAIAKWTLYDRTITISGNGEMKDWSSDSNGDWHNSKYTKVIGKVKIENGVTSIENWAFKGCSSLTSITIPNSVTSVGNAAFEGCSSLTSITIPNSVTSVGNAAFEGCSSLTSIEIPNSVTSIGVSAFLECSSLSSITIPNSVKSIGYNAFEGCSMLENIYVEENNSKHISIDGVLYNKEKTELICYPAGKKQNKYIIPNSVTSIEYGAFSGCRSLTSITIPNSVTSISWNAFRECSSLTSINIPNGVKSIDSSAFSSCSSLTNIEIPNSVTSIGVSAFSSCSSLTNIEIPNSVTSIGGSAFWGCSSLTSIEIPNSVTSIGDYAFSRCSSLTSINIPEGVTSIGGSAFWGCSSLTSITIPKSVTSIGMEAFYECSSLTSITIPNSVTSISWNAFRECSSLTNIIIPKSVTSIGKNTFYECKGPVICKKNSIAHKNLEENKTGYILDSKAPVAIYTPNGNETAVKSIKSSVKVEDDYALNEESLRYLWSQKEEVTAEEITEKLTNGEELTSPEKIEGKVYLYIYAEDIVGNETIIKSNAFNVDDLPPQIGIEYSTIEPTNQNVTVTITSHEKVQNVEGWTLSKDKLKLTKVFEKNEAEEITVKDLIGNETKANIEVKNIDKIPAVIEVEYSNINPTNQNVTATIRSNEKLQQKEGWTLSEDGLKLTKEYEQNKSEEIIAKDLAGNETKANINISNIDKKVPVVEVSYSNKELTKENVIVTITGSEKLQQIEGWTLSEDGLKLTKEYEENENKEWDVKDLAGNIAKTKIEITNIDKKAPVIEGVKNKRIYANKVTPKAVDENLESVKLEKEGQEVVGYENGTIITELGTYKITAIDKVGNKTEVEFYIKDIPSTEEVVEYTVSPEGLTNQDVKVSVTKKENEEYKDLLVQMSTDGKNYEATTEKSLKENGTVYIRVVKNEEDGTIIEGEVIEVEIKNIDKTAPEAQVTYSETNPTNQNVTATITANEEIQEIEGWTRGEDRKTLTKEYIQNAKEEVTIKDIVGNETKVNVEITNIDKTAPEAQVTYSETNPTNKNITATITANEEIQEVEGWTISQDKKKLTKEYDANKTEKVIIKDKVGNRKEVEVKVLNIDKTAPIVNVSYNTKKTTNQNVRVTITASEKVQGLTGWTLSTDSKTLTKEYSTNKTETITIKDLAGNSTNATIEITNIDKTAPTINVKHSTTNLTNGNVTVTVTANEEVQSVVGWALSNDKKSITKTYQSNAEENVQLKDIAGNTTNAKISIKNIDKEKPVITGVENGKVYKDSVTPKATDANPGTLLLEKDGTKVEGYTNGKEILEEGTYKLTATDKVGNTTIVNFTIKYVKGDLNENDQIDIGDVLLLLRHIAQSNSEKTLQKHPDWKLNEKRTFVGDINKNGTIDIGDVLKLRRYMAAKANKSVSDKHPDWLNIE